MYIFSFSGSSFRFTQDEEMNVGSMERGGHVYANATVYRTLQGWHIACDAIAGNGKDNMK